MPVTERGGGRRAWVVPALVGLLVVSAWLASGVALRDVAGHLLYVLLVGFGPGVVLVALLSGCRDSLIVLGAGCAAGMALEVLGVVVAANLGVWWLAPLVPAFTASTVWYLTRRPRLRWPSPPPGPGVAVAVAVSVGLVFLLCLGWLLPFIPLPGTTAGVVSYDYDSLFRLGIAADALHHWPPANPSIAGQDLPYHTWAYVREASEARVTGIDLPVIAFRLDVTTTAIALVLAIGALARTAGAGALGVGLAPLLLLSAGELDLHPDVDFPFSGAVVQYLATDPSTGLGLTLFAGAATALWQLAEDHRDRGRLVLAMLLLFGAIGAKVPAVPVLFGGALLLCAWQLLVRRSLIPGLVAGLSLSAVAVGLGVVFLYSGAGHNPGPALSPLAAIEEMEFIRALRSSGAVGAIPGYDAVPDALQTVILAFAGIAGLAAAALSGLALRRRRAKTDACTSSPDGWLVALTLAGALPFLLLNLSGNEIYFAHYGLLAGTVLAAARFDRYAWQLGCRGRHRRFIAAAAGAMAFGLAAAVWISHRGPELGPSIRPTVLAISLAVALAIGLHRLSHSRTAIGPLICAAIMGLGLLDGPLDTVPRSIDAARHDTVFYATGGRGLTNELLTGLRWIRDRTPNEAVIAVNNHFTDDEGSDPRAFQYSAFSERRVYLQSWLYTPGAARLGSDRVREGAQPYPELERVNTGAFEGDRGALQELRRAGVGYLVLDRRYGHASARLSRSATRVFSNPAVVVFEL